MVEGERYKGWIPTVVGRLSFRAIGDTSYPDRSISKNQVFTSEAGRLRYIACYQRRPLGDSAFPYLSNPILGETGTFYFVLTSVSRDDEPHNNMLGGQIYVFTSPNWSIAKDEIRHLVKLDGGIAHPDFNENWVTACAYLRRHSDTHTEFELKRDGSCAFFNLKANSSGILDEIHPQDLYNQCYFFLRDIVHKHQHHDPGADTIITLRCCAEVEPDDAWKRHVMYSLIYYLIQAKRKHMASVQARMLGVIAYARSFRTISGLTDLPYQLGNITRSISAKNAELAARDGAMSGVRTLIYSIAIGSVAILVAISNFVSIRSVNGKANPGATRIVDAFADQADKIIFGVAVLATFAILASLRKKIIETAFIKDLGRVIMKLLSYTWAPIFLYSLGIVLIMVAYRTITSAF